MKLRSKILIGYSVVLTLVILVCGWGVVNLRRLGKASEAILEENYRSILAAENMIDAIERQDSAVLLFLLENQSQGQEQFLANEFEFLQWYSRAEDNITIAGEKELLEVLEKHYQNYLNVAELNQQLTDSANYYEEILPVFQEVRQTCIKLRDLNQQTMVVASERAQEISEQATWSMIAAGGAAAGLGLTFSLLLSNRLVKPLKEMTLATDRIAEGDYEVEIVPRSQDELGSLGRGITTMSQSLKAFHELNVGKVIAEKQRNEAIIYSISDGIVVVDAEFKIMAINPTAANIINTKPQLATGNHFLTVFNNQKFYQRIEKTAQTGKSPPLAEEEEAILP
ncbi:MAG: HAMP domain-containing protein, partial [Spirulinaceae cyanobacterium]